MIYFQPNLQILPAAQRELWAQLAPVQELGYVLYGGTAIALRLAHRQSVDFDFFSSHPVDPEELRRRLPFLLDSELVQQHKNTFEVKTDSGVKVSFFGGLSFGRIGEPELTDDGVMVVAAMNDLMATKLKVILQRSELKDYQDIAAMIRAGVKLEPGLAAAEQMYRPNFSPIHSLKALVYFDDGDLTKLTRADRDLLMAATAKVKSLPDVKRTMKLDALPDNPDRNPKFKGPEMG